MEFADSFADLCRQLGGGGAFLVVQGRDRRPNPMTIGWGGVGVVWGEPIFTVLVRPSRFTFSLMEQAKRFSICVPLGGRLKSQLAFCGSHSGRDCDKVKECGLQAGAGIAAGVSVLEDCDFFYECEIVHKTQVLQKTLEPAIVGRFYPAGDFHTLYHGRILHAYRRAA